MKTMKRLTKNWPARFANLALAFLVPVPQALACPMCSDLVERGKDAFKAFGFAKGISWSILVMISIPYLMVGGLFLAVRRSTRRRREAMKP